MQSGQQPLIKIAVQEIVEWYKIDPETVFTEKDLEQILDIKASDPEFRFAYLEVRNRLLYNHGIALSKMRGLYKLLSDSEKVKIENERLFRRQVNAARRQSKLLQTVDPSKLPEEDRPLYERGLVKNGLLLAYHHKLESKNLEPLLREASTDRPRIIG